METAAQAASSKTLDDEKDVEALVRDVYHGLRAPTYEYLIASRSIAGGGAVAACSYPFSCLTATDIIATLDPSNTKGALAHSSGYVLSLSDSKRRMTEIVLCHTIAEYVRALDRERPPGLLFLKPYYTGSNPDNRPAQLVFLAKLTDRWRCALCMKPTVRKELETCLKCKSEHLCHTCVTQSAKRTPYCFGSQFLLRKVEDSVRTEGQYTCGGCPRALVYDTKRCSACHTVAYCRQECQGFDYRAFHGRKSKGKEPSECETMLKEYKKADIEHAERIDMNVKAFTTEEIERLCAIIGFQPTPKDTEPAMRSEKMTIKITLTMISQTILGYLGTPEYEVPERTIAAMIAFRFTTPEQREQILTEYGDEIVPLPFGPHRIVKSFSKVNGKYQSIGDLPAMIVFNEQTGARAFHWMKAGLHHRDTNNRPAMTIHVNGVEIVRQWFRNGVQCNEEGVPLDESTMQMTSTPAVPIQLPPMNTRPPTRAEKRLVQQMMMSNETPAKSGNP